MSVAIIISTVVNDTLKIQKEIKSQQENEKIQKEKVVNDTLKIQKEIKSQLQQKPCIKRVEKKCFYKVQTIITYPPAPVCR